MMTITVMLSWLFSTEHALLAMKSPAAQRNNINKMWTITNQNDGAQ
jgi:hypothetical protein